MVYLVEGCLEGFVSDLPGPEGYDPGDKLILKAHSKQVPCNGNGLPVNILSDGQFLYLVCFIKELKIYNLY